MKLAPNGLIYEIRIPRSADQPLPSEIFIKDRFSRTYNRLDPSKWEAAKQRKMNCDDMLLTLGHLGFSMPRDKLEKLLNGKTDITSWEWYLVFADIGSGHYDYETDAWTPGSDQLYAFDMEVPEMGTMYTRFLQGVQSIVPDIAITDIREDLSGLNEDFDGRRSVSFLCNGRPYRFDLKGEHDWFDLCMLDHMKKVLEAENCPFRLYAFECDWIILYYGPQDKAEKISGLMQL